MPIDLVVNFHFNLVTSVVACLVELPLFSYWMDWIWVCMEQGTGGVWCSI